MVPLASPHMCWEDSPPTRTEMSGLGLRAPAGSAADRFAISTKTSQRRCADARFRCACDKLSPWIALASAHAPASYRTPEIVASSAYQFLDAAYYELDPPPRTMDLER